MRDVCGPESDMPCLPCFCFITSKASSKNKYAAGGYFAMSGARDAAVLEQEVAVLKAYRDTLHETMKGLVVKASGALRGNEDALRCVAVPCITRLRCALRLPPHRCHPCLTLRSFARQGCGSRRWRPT